ncbi:MAG: CPBP family intramembrane metalloprotease [Peptococcaceae bacterium]|nr:CPBP family intramembrane metalloprotease [Peptococcaceae bacterium]
MIFKNKYGEIRSGWGLSLLGAAFIAVQFMVVMIVGVAALVMAAAEAPVSDTAEYQNRVAEMASRLEGSYGVQYFMLVMIIGVVLLLFWLLYKRPLAQMGLDRKGWLKQLLFGCVFGIVSMGLVVAVLVLTKTASITHVDWSGVGHPGFIGGLVLFIFVGFNEELMSRGFMMTALKTTRLKWLIVVLPAVMFSVLHIPNFWVMQESVQAYVVGVALVNLMLVGILFAFLFIKTGRLWAPIGYHITWNFFQGSVFGMAVSGGDGKVSIMNTVFAGPDWVTGGAFGAEGGVVCTLVILLGLIYVRFFMKKPGHVFWSMDSDMPLQRGVRGMRT